MLVPTALKSLIFLRDLTSLPFGLVFLRVPTLCQMGTYFHFITVLKLLMVAPQLVSPYAIFQNLSIDKVMFD